MFEILTVEQLLERLSKYNHKELHIHHTWKPNHAAFTGDNGLQLQQNMRNYHVNSLGWSDIGQHVTLLPDGRFVTGRDFGKTPASIKGYNTGSFACEMLGNFDIGHDKLEGPQKESILKLAKWFDYRGKYIRFHRENSIKTCPGSSIDKQQFMEEVRGVKVDIQQAVPVVSKPKPPRKIVTGKDIFKELQRELNDQLRANLRVDGVPGTKTLNECPTVRQGAKGNITKWIQKRLIALGYNVGIWGADGSFGDGTYNAVKTFQKAKGLTPDGIIGQNTWKKLLGL